MSQTVSIHECKEFLQELGLHHASVEYKIGLIMFAVLHSNTNCLETVAKASGLSLKRGIVQKYLRRMEDLGYFSTQKFEVEWTKEGYPEEAVTTAFICDMMVIKGDFARKLSEAGDYLYSISDQGKSFVTSR